MSSETPNYSIIGEATRDVPELTENTDRLFALEVSDVENAQRKFQKELHQANLKKLTMDIAELEQTIKLRTKFSTQILHFLWAFSAFCCGVVLLSGFHAGGFSLDTVVLTTLVGGTSASVFGLISVVLGGLFRPIRTSDNSKKKT